MEKIEQLIRKIYIKFPVLVFDLLAIPFAWYLSFCFRFNLNFLPEKLLTTFSLMTISILSVLQIACYYHFKVYRGLWCFFSLKDVSRIIQAVSFSVFLVIPILFFTSLSLNIPRSILPLYSIFLVMLLCGGRLATRLAWDNFNKSKTKTHIKRVLIIGAGKAGDGLIRDLKRSDLFFPVGLVDDNHNKLGLELHGVPVIGLVQDLHKLIEKYKIDLIFIAIPSASSEIMRRIVELCAESKIDFRTLPSLQMLAEGRVEVNALREVSIEDLLGRDQVRITWDKIHTNIIHKRVLVTGAGGSIGSELCRQIMAQKPDKLLILDNSEYNLYKIELELRESFPETELEIALVNVVDRVAVDGVFQQFNPEIVFHAAAYKHVPMLEDQVRVAVQNNIIGTQIIAEASVAIGVLKFILISTDKAVNPTNIMGTTKRVAEIYCQNLDSRVSTQFITVRFGNVLGSVGSVVPLFQRQIRNGGPLTVTHPDMQRYFMTIVEASQLILQAMVNGDGGEIFVLDMGEPIKISYLAEQLIKLSGKEPGTDIAIKYTGLRPGEKLYEELFHESEQLVITDHEKLYKAKFREIDWNRLIQTMLMLNVACEMHKNEDLILLLKSLVPEYNSDGSLPKNVLELNLSV